MFAKNTKRFQKMGFLERKSDLLELGKLLKSIILSKSSSSVTISLPLEELLRQVSIRNPWFTNDSVMNALEVWSDLLNPESIEHWLSGYEIPQQTVDAKVVGVVNAGNIPFVGLHDLLTVYISGHRYLAKNASDDPFLLPWLTEVWATVCPHISNSISFTDRLSGIDAVIATGSDNSARYFEYYFSKYPHIIRKNRNGIAILDGHESPSDLSGLGRDIFTYYGLGCRNVAKLYLPRGFEISVFFEAMYPFHSVMEHYKYMNNFDHHHAVYLLKGIPFLQNNFLILKEEQAIASPLAVVHYEFYDDQDLLLDSLMAKKEVIQCIATSEQLMEKIQRRGLPAVRFGETQSPSLSDYADGVDTLEFLLKL